MKKINIFAPQWQGAGLSRDLYEGSHALKSFIEHEFNCNFHDAAIDENSRPELKMNILGYDLIAAQLSGIENLLESENPQSIFTLGGGCGIEIPVVSYLQSLYGNLTLFWFDAHGDLNSPESSPSKHFHGMPLRFLTDDDENFSDLKITKIPADNVYLLGARDLDIPETAYIQKKGIKHLNTAEISNSRTALNLMNKKNQPAYIHIDLDVLDPEEYRNVKCPTHNGLSIHDLTDTIGSIDERMNIVGLSIVENTETDVTVIQKLKPVINLGMEL